MKEVYIVDYLVHDCLGTDVANNYSRMPATAGPTISKRYDHELYPNVLCTNGYHMDHVPVDYTPYKLTVDLVEAMVAKYPVSEVIARDTAVVFGSFAIGSRVWRELHDAFTSGMRRFSPTKLFTGNHDLLSAFVQGKMKLQGVNTSINAACSSSMFNLHYAAMLIQTGQCSSAVVGAVDMPIEAKTQYYWQCTSAISTNNGGTCIPFDKSRDGFLQGEGGTMWLVCDEETVIKHNLTPKAKLRAIANGAKVTSMTAHDKTCESQIGIINRAFAQAGLAAKDMAFFNAHATSTEVGDDIEMDVFQRVFHDVDIPIVSFKGYIGHTMSACGLIESAYGIEAVKNQYLHPNRDLTNPLSDDPRLITTGCKLTGPYFMKASFGFGGRTSVAIFEVL